RADQREAFWCPGKDSNLHGLHHWYLKPARLPIPPPGPGARHSGSPQALSTQGRLKESALIDTNRVKRHPSSSHPRGRGDPVFAKQFSSAEWPLDSRFRGNERSLVT